MVKARSSILLLIIPFSLFFIGFTIPLIWAMMLSTYNNDGVFVGMLNYLKAFKDNLFWSSISFTLLYAASVTVTMATMGFFIALAVDKFGRGQGIAKSVMLIPWAISLTAWGLMAQVISSQSYGLLNDFLLKMGIIKVRVAWLGTPVNARLTVMLFRVIKDVWFSTLLFLVARQTLPAELYEEGRVCGANPFQVFRYITVPMLRTTILYVFTIQLIFALQEFDLIYALTRGGPGFATETAALSIFRTGIYYGNYAFGTALTTVWSVLVSFFAVLVFGRILIKVIRR